VLPVRTASLALELF